MAPPGGPLRSCEWSRCTRKWTQTCRLLGRDAGGQGDEDPTDCSWLAPHGREGLRSKETDEGRTLGCIEGREEDPQLPTREPSAQLGGEVWSKGPREAVVRRSPEDTADSMPVQVSTARPLLRRCTHL